MLRQEIGNIGSAKASNLRLKNNLTGFPLSRLRLIDQFNSSSLGDLSSEHGGELYSEDARCRTKICTPDLPKLRAPGTRWSGRSVHALMFSEGGAPHWSTHARRSSRSNLSNSTRRARELR